MMVTVKTTAATTGMATYNPIVNALMLPETFIILLVGSATIKEHFSVKLSAIKMTFLLQQMNEFLVNYHFKVKVTINTS